MTQRQTVVPVRDFGRMDGAPDVLWMSGGRVDPICGGYMVVDVHRFPPSNTVRDIYEVGDRVLHAIKDQACR